MSGRSAPRGAFGRLSEGNGMGMELVAALASVAAAVCAATAIAMQVRAHRELERSRARMDEASVQMARANEALVSVQSVLSQVLTTTQATLNQAASTSIVEQQHFDSQAKSSAPTSRRCWKHGKRWGRKRWRSVWQKRRGSALV